MPLKKSSSGLTGKGNNFSFGSGAGGFGAPASSTAVTSGGFGGANFNSTANSTATSSTGNTSFGQFGNSQGTSGSATTLTQKCGLSDIEEVRLAYAPLLRLNENAPPTPTVEYIEPGVAKQSNKSCELYCWVYSPFDPNTRKVHDSHDLQRREADKKNPDPSNLESEKIIGAASLKKRFDCQIELSTQSKKELEKLHKALLVVERSARKDHDRIKELEVHQERLYHKYLTVLRKVELLRCHGSAITLNEQKCRDKLDKIVRAVQVPSVKLQELLIIQSQIDRTFHDVYDDDLSPEDVKKLCGALEKQREGLQYLTDILSKDARDLGIIQKKMSQLSDDK